MPFTEENKPLLEAAAAIDFQFRKDGRVNYRRHGPYERGLYFIKKAISIHGSKYGYSKVNYIDSHNKVTITCGQHGDFEQTPSKHLHGRGCSKCAGNYSPNTSEFIEIARSVHGERYDYSSVQYKNNQEKVEITCPIHGSFFVSPNSHIQGSGCPKCAGNMPLGTMEFIARAQAVHENFYSYELVKYKNNREKVEIICPIHGPLSQSPNHHLNGHGCSKCVGTYSPTTEEFIKKATLVRGDQYNYDLVDYKCSHEKITISCRTHGPPFEQTPGHHLDGENCPKCAGKNHNILYLLKCNNTGWYKIGITTDNVQRRLNGIGGDLEEIYHVKLEYPRKHESILHKRYAKDRKHNLCVKEGKTEFFSLTKNQVQEVISYMDEVSNA